MTTFRTQRLFHELNRQEYQYVIQNQGATPTLPAFFDAANWRGKFFHRGCHGWLERIELFVRNTALVAQNITVGLSNYPGGVERATIIVACAPGDNWCTVNVQMQWQWDGLFIYAYVHGANTSLAFDLCTTSNELPDSYYSTTALIEGPWTRDFTAIDALRINRRYHIRAYISQSVGDVPVTGHVSIVEVGPHLRVVLTDEEGNITGVGLPLYATTIIGSDEPYFNAMIDGEERQKAYAAGDPFTGGWAAARDFYPYSVTVILRADHDYTIRPPCYLEYEGIYVAITSSDGQRIFTGTLGRDRNIDWDLMTYEGHQYWTGIFKSGQMDLVYRNIAADVSLTVLVKNSSGITLDYVEIYVLGATYPIA